MRRTFIVLCGAAAFRVGAAQAGTVRAQLTVAPEHSDAPEGLWRIDNGVLPVLPRPVDLHGECVLLLVPRGTPPKPAHKEETVTAELRGLRAIPAVSVVPLGASFELKNEDQVPHTIASLAPDDSILPPRPIPASSSRIERMQRPGVFVLADDELPHLRAYLIVTEGGVALRPDDHGAIHADVPDGAYTMKLFAHGAFVSERDLDVGAHPIELTLSVPARAKPAASDPMAVPHAGTTPDAGTVH